MIMNSVYTWYGRNCVWVISNGRDLTTEISSIAQKRQQIKRVEKLVDTKSVLFIYNNNTH